MKKRAIEILAKEIAAKLVEADPRKLQDVTNLYVCFQKLSEEASKVNLDMVTAVASTAANLAEKIILEEIADRDNVFDILTQTITFIQDVMRDGRGKEGITFPEGLGLQGKEGEVKSKDEKKWVEFSKPDASPGITEEGKEDSFGRYPELIVEFIAGAREHLETLNVQLLSLETDPENEEVLNEVFRVFHNIKGAAGSLSFKKIEKLAHHSETLLDKARKKELLLVDDVIDVIFDSVNTLKRLINGILFGDKGLVGDSSFSRLLLSINEIASGRAVSDSSPVLPSDPDKKLGEILVDRGVATPEMIENILEEQQKAAFPRPKLGDGLVKKGVSAKEIAHALRSQKDTATPQIRIKKSLKVDADRLGILVDTIGELVDISSMISQDREVLNGTSSRLLGNLTQMDKVIRELQDLSLSIKMVPIKSTFQKIARMVRDLARKTGKKVQFSMSGEDTELDRNVVDHIGDPLIHLVRNAVDHGIEDSVEERLKAGKDEIGKIALHAFHRGGKVYIQIEDDGRGINKDDVLAKAKERGLVEEGQNLSDHEICNLIFNPGFSTAKKVTSFSGRGVGLDVVKRNIESLQGSVEVNSAPGKGSTFNLITP